MRQRNHRVPTPSLILQPAGRFRLPRKKLQSFTSPGLHTEALPPYMRFMRRICQRAADREATA
jgi:hypothetical protein